MTDISIIICTYNRSQNLPALIQKLEQQERIEELNWDVVVIDNNSSDDTKNVVQSITQHSKLNIRYIFEEKQGTSYARNRGINDTDSLYLAFIDDDILVSPMWLYHIYQPISQQNYDVIAGRIHLDQIQKLPKWITPTMYGFLGYQDFGETPIQLSGDRQFPFAGNMAFNRRVIDLVGYFNTRIGRKGSGTKGDAMFKGAEAEFFQRLAKAGGTFFYAPGAIVHHQILPFQLKKSYFRLIHYKAGYQRALFDKEPYKRRFLGIPLFLFPQLIRAYLKYINQIWNLGINAAFRQQMTAGYFVGMIHGHIKQWKTSGKTTKTSRIDQ